MGWFADVMFTTIVCISIDQLIDQKHDLKIHSKNASADW